MDAVGMPYVTRFWSSGTLGAMKIVIVVLDAGLGGHTRTSVSVGKAMRSRGHEVHYLVGVASPTKVIEDAGFQFDRIAHGWSSGLITKLQELKAAGRLDAVHTFSSLGLVEILKFASKSLTPWVYTRCGGPAVKEPLEVRIMSSLKLRFATCLSEENKLEILETAAAKPEDVIVVPARIDVDEIQELQSAEKASEFRTKYKIPADAPIFLRIARIGPAYRDSILDGVAVTEAMNKAGIPICFVHIGYADVTSIAEEIYAEVARVNSEAGKVIAVSAVDESTSAQKYLGMASVICGMGRSVFEGLAAGKPTFVVGKVGFAGVVSAETVDALAEFNFSGRNVGDGQARAETRKLLQAALTDAIQSEARQAELGAFALNYARTKLDVQVSAPVYEALYKTYRPEWMSSSSDLSKAGLFSFIKRGLRSMLSKSARAQISAKFNLRQGAK